MDSRTPRSPSVAHACYLLGFSPSDERLQENQLTLLAQFGVELSDVGAITAWFKQIERSEFEGSAAEKNLADIQWLTPRVLAHETIVSIISQRIPLYPSRFGALFSSLDPIRELASINLSLLLTFFDRIRGKSEWGVKFFGDSARMAEIAAQREGILHDGKATSGVNYLKLRQMQRAQSIAAAGTFQAQVTNAIEVLQTRYKELAARPILNSAKNTSTEQLLGNIAVLVLHGEHEHLVTWANDWNTEQYNSSGMHAQVTGPWPVYSFCPKLVDLNDRSEAA